jgi:hypothetical protein
MRPNPTALLLLLAALATPAAAQERHRRWEAPPRFYAGADLLFAQPLGSFADQIDQGFGAGAHLLFRPASTEIVGLRLDADFVQYGHESRRVPLSPTVGGRIDVDLVTDNYVAIVGFGPQIGLPRGRVQPYANGTIGVAYFGTQSSLHGARGGDSFASTENYHDAAFTWGGGGGAYVPIVRGRIPVSLDFAVRYQHNGEVSYLKEGGIHDNPDGSITLDPIHGEADFLTFRIGATVGLRGRHCRGRRCGR